MKVKVFTAKRWSQIDELEKKINSFLEAQSPQLHISDVRTDLAVTTESGEPTAIVTVWYP